MRETDNFNCSTVTGRCSKRSPTIKIPKSSKLFLYEEAESKDDFEADIYSLQTLQARVENSKYFDPLVLFTRAYFKGIPILSFVDSGSQVSLISKKMAEMLELREDCANKIYISDLSQSKTPACACYAPINYRGCRGEGKFYIIKNLKNIVKSDILIGFDLINLVRQQTGNFDFPTKKFKEKQKRIGRSYIPKPLPDERDVLRTFQRHRGDLIRTAREHDISANRVYKIIMDSSHILGSETPYIFMNRVNPNWFYEVVNHYNNLLESIIMLRRADPLENAQCRSVFKVIEKAREPSKIPAQEIVAYFEHVGNFEDVAVKYNLSEDQVIDSIQSLKKFPNKDLFINYVLEQQAIHHPEIYELYYDDISGDNNYDTFRFEKAKQKITGAKKKLKTAGSKVKGRMGDIKGVLKEKGHAAKIAAKKKYTEGRAKFRNAGLMKGNKYVQIITFPGSEQAWAIDEVLSQLESELFNALIDDARDKIIALNPFKQTKNMNHYQLLMDKFLKEFEPEIRGSVIIINLPPERTSSGKAYFTNQMINIMSQERMGANFVNKYRVNAKAHGNHPYWRTKVEILIKISNSGKLSFEIGGTFHTRHKNNAIRQIDELANWIHGIFS